MTTCVICIEDMTPIEEHKLKCNHSFHSRCLAEWLLEHKTCPCCRKNVSRLPTSVRSDALLQKFYEECDKRNVEYEAESKAVRERHLRRMEERREAQRPKSIADCTIL